MASNGGAPMTILGATSCTGSGATYYASPTGTGNSCTLSSPCSLGTAAGKPKPGDIVCLRGGTYATSLFETVSGSASAWISFVAYPGELPILNGGSGVAVNGTYVSFNGIASLNASTGFGNMWTGSGTTNSNGHLEFVNCIADLDTANGIAFRSATGVHVGQSIVAHTGASTAQSNSSGVDIFGAQGPPDENIIERTVSFENVDNQAHTDGSGFIFDDIGTGGTFVNNIGFRNGGSCIRLTISTNSHIINNSCYHDGLDTQATNPNNPGEIFFSSSQTLTGAILQNNLAAADGYNGMQDAFNLTGSLPIAPTNVGENAPGAAAFFTDPAGNSPDFHLSSSAGSTIVGAGSTANGAPISDIGFDPKCITEGAPTGNTTSATLPTWWSYSINYSYIESIGGVASCFNPSPRTGNPDLGAYQH
jgi:hypothetical protein